MFLVVLRPSRFGVENLTATDLGAAVLAANAAVYGFVIAFYIFSRGLQEQEKAVVIARLTLPEVPGLSMAAEAAVAAWRRVEVRAARVNMIFLASTVLGLVGLALGVGFLGGNDGDLVWELTVFGLFLILVEIWVVFVAALNLSEVVHYLKGPDGKQFRLRELFGLRPGGP